MSWNACEASTVFVGRIVELHRPDIVWIGARRVQRSGSRLENWKVAVAVQVGELLFTSVHVPGIVLVVRT